MHIIVIIIHIFYATSFCKVKVGQLIKSMFHFGWMSKLTEIYYTESIIMAGNKEPLQYHILCNPRGMTAQLFAWMSGVHQYLWLDFTYYHCNYVHSNNHKVFVEYIRLLANTNMKVSFNIDTIQQAAIMI